MHQKKTINNHKFTISNYQYHCHPQTQNIRKYYQLFDFTCLVLFFAIYLCFVIVHTTDGTPKHASRLKFSNFNKLKTIVQLTNIHTFSVACFFEGIARILLRLKLRVVCWKSSPMIYISSNAEFNSLSNDMQIIGWFLTRNTQFDAQQNALNTLKEARNRKGMVACLRPQTSAQLNPSNLKT